MDQHASRRRYRREEADTRHSDAVLETVEAHENTSLSADEFPLFEHANPDAIDMLYGTSDAAVSIRIEREHVSVSVWSAVEIDIRVVDSVDMRSNVSPRVFGDRGPMTSLLAYDRRVPSNVPGI